MQCLTTSNYQQVKAGVPELQQGIRRRDLLRVACSRLLITCCGLRIACNCCRLQIACCRITRNAVDCGLRIACCGMRIACKQLLRGLRIACCGLRDVKCLLQVAGCSTCRDLRVNQAMLLGHWQYKCVYDVRMQLSLLAVCAEN